jgi:hypothetical protein
MAHDQQPGALAQQRFRVRARLGTALVVMAVVAASRMAGSQDYISGRVVSDVSDKPISGARVGIKGASERVVTDSSGRFRMVRPPAVEARVVAWSPGHLIAGATWSADRSA